MGHRAVPCTPPPPNPARPTNHLRTLADANAPRASTLDTQSRRQPRGTLVDIRPGRTPAGRSRPRAAFLARRRGNGRRGGPRPRPAPKPPRHRPPGPGLLSPRLAARVGPRSGPARAPEPPPPLFRSSSRAPPRRSKSVRSTIQNSPLHDSKRRRFAPRADGLKRFGPARGPRPAAWSEPASRVLAARIGPLAASARRRPLVARLPPISIFSL